MKTKAILIAALFSAGLLLTSCNKGGEPAPRITIYPDGGDTTEPVPPVLNDQWNSLLKEKKELEKSER